jgi:hypothetical protein
MPENYVLLERTELNASAASVTFANIPQTGYTDLKLVMSARSDQTGSVGQDVYVRFNGDSGANYSFRRLYGNGSAAYSDAVSSSSTAGRIGRCTSNDATASTFGNTEFYIPNYTSSNQKSISGDAVDETNATGTIDQMTATIWTGTASISSMQLFPFSGGTNFIAGSTFSLYGIAALGTTPAIAPKAYGGNVIATDGTYWYHAFTSSGSFVPQVGLSCDVLVVAGGGGGGNNASGVGGGGGGAGGVLSFTSESLTATNYSVAVGGGGAASTSGTSSTFTGLTSLDGGGRGGNGSQLGIAGGSGGGGGGGQAGGTATSLQGNNGGTGAGNQGAGGGGKGAVGGNATGGVGAAGNGGAGSNTWSSWLSATSLGVSGYIAGGGGGGGNPGTTTAAGTGGSGGGANGSYSGTPSAATTNTGSGGGGGGYNTTPFNGSAGGSGIVIIRYLAA